MKRIVLLSMLSALYLGAMSLVFSTEFSQENTFLYGKTSAPATARAISRPERIVPLRVIANRKSITSLPSAKIYANEAGMAEGVAEGKQTQDQHQ
jgi:hypothetical protein